MPTSFARIRTRTFVSILQDCVYSVLVSVLVLCNYCVITVVSDNIVQPLKNPSQYLNAEDKAVLDLYDQNELSLYDGVQKPELYLSIIGNIFDVTRAKKHYGPDSTYHIFVGRDNSKAFITGQFKQDDISDDILKLPPADVIGIQNWIKFYKKSYSRKGKLIGRYYDSSGQLTAYGKQLKEILKQSERDLANKSAIKHRFPDCNVEWEPQKGSKFWCSNQRVMSESELQEEEREVLLSIYDGDDCFKLITPTAYQYKYGKDNDIKSFVVEIRWGEQYPQKKPEIYMDSFYNKHLLQSLKDKIVSMLFDESEQYIGMSMTYSLFEFIKEKFDDLIVDQPDDALEADICAIDKIVISDQNQLKKQWSKKESLTKGQKRKQWDRSDNKGEKPRGWNWVDIVKHLSQTGSKEDSVANTTSTT